MGIIHRMNDYLDTRKHAKSVESYNRFMAKRNGEDSCYYAEEHDCSGSCQGASDCLLARYYRGEKKKPTPFQMRMYEIKSKKCHEDMDKFLSSLDLSEFTK